MKYTEVRVGSARSLCIAIQPIVGKKSDILAGDLKHQVELGALAGNRLVDLPLRDPMTMRPVGAASPSP